MYLRFCSGFIIAAACICGGTDAAGNTADGEKLLRLKFNSGQSYRCDFRIKMEALGRGILNKTASSILNQRVVSRIAVQNVDSGGLGTIDTKIESVQIKMSDMQGNQTNYDSRIKDSAAEGPGAVMGKVLGALVGTDITSVINARGNFISNNAADRLADLMRKNPEHAASILGAANGDNLRQLSGLPPFKLPEKPVAIGATWTETGTFATPLIGNVNADFNYTYEGTVELEGKPCDKIACAIALRPKEDQVTRLRIRLKDQKVVQETYLDAATGWQVENRLDQAFTFELMVRGETATQDIHLLTVMTVTPVDAPIVGPQVGN